MKFNFYATLTPTYTPLLTSNVHDCVKPVKAKQLYNYCYYYSLE